MNIILVGSGKVGLALAEQLSLESHDVTVIDSQDRTLSRASDTLDVMTVKGNGVSPAVLRDAGVAFADLLVAVTGSDEINMVCCRTAKNIGAKKTIARIRNPEYANALNDLKRDMGIDIIINPENATAVEISRLLRFPSAANIDTFFRGRVELISLRLREEDFIVDKPLYDLSSQVKKMALLFCVVQRNDDVIIPNGAFVPQAGDKLYIIGRPASLTQFLRILGRLTTKVRRVMLVGGGKISVYLAAMLQTMKMQVKLVESDMERCRTINESLPKIITICGDGTDQELLDSEGLDDFDAFVALTGRDEDNLMISLYANQKKISKVIAKCNRQNYSSIARSIGLDSIISPKQITTEHILQVARGMQNSQGNVMNALYRIADEQVEAVEFIVGATTKQLGVPLKDLQIKSGILIAAIMRKSEVLIPEGSTSMLENDLVIIISHGKPILDLNDIFDDGYATGGGSDEL